MLLNRFSAKSRQLFTEMVNATPVLCNKKFDEIGGICKSLLAQIFLLEKNW